MTAPVPGPGGRGPVYIVVNHRFRPADRCGPFGFGVENFTIGIGDRLAADGRLGGFIFYRRLRGGERPGVRTIPFPRFPAAECAFSFRQPAAQIALQMERAARLAGGDTGGMTFYHQSGVTLPYAPRNSANVVTHHGPFVSDVEAVVGPDLAAEAFEGGVEKREALRMLQARGLSLLRRSSEVVAAEVSPVQCSSLRRRGIGDDRILLLSPPVAPAAAADTASPGAEIEAFIARWAGSAFLISAAARLDEFKNLGVFVAAGCALMMERRDVALICCGDEAATPERRAALRALVPPEVSARTLILPRLPRPLLLGLGARLAGRGLFVFPSRFETLGITALEMIGCGLATLASGEPARVGMSAYLDESYRFRPEPEPLLAKLREAAAGDLRAAGLDQRRRLAALGGLDSCYRGLCAAFETARSRSLQSLRYAAA